MKMNKYHRVMEIFWLVVAIVTAIFAGYQLSQGRTEDMTLMLVMPFVAGALFAIRRFHRKRMEKMDKED